MFEIIYFFLIGTAIVALFGRVCYEGDYDDYD